MRAPHVLVLALLVLAGLARSQFDCRVGDFCVGHLNAQTCNPTTGNCDCDAGFYDCRDRDGDGDENTGNDVTHGCRTNPVNSDSFCAPAGAGCGSKCAHLEECNNGVCDCALDMCSGACTDTTRDINNCGACGTICAGRNMECDAGVCQCRAPQTACNGVCVDTTRNANNCGACGALCTGKNRICSAGVCSCVAGTTDCGAVPCVDLNSNPSYCGDCFTACPRNYHCVGGDCVHV